MTRVHLDHNATTPLRPEVRERLLEVQAELAGNPSSLHTGGRRARHLLDEARERTARALLVDEDELIFTSGGTESNNLAVLGAVRARGPRAGLVTTTIEHSSVLGPAERLAREGRLWSRAEVDGDGRARAARLAELAQEPECALVSVMATNNEVGSRMPLEELGARLAALPEDTRPLFHSDAIQAFGRIELPIRPWGLDLVSLSAHKLGGPVGVGVLVRRKGVLLEPLMVGGEQEGGLRPGTENVVGIVAASLAFELAASEREAFCERAGALARALWEGLHAALPEARLVGPAIDSENRMPGTLNVLLPGVDGKVLVTRLDLDGLEVSAGSACASGSLEPSHVLRAMGHDETDARAGLRLSVGRSTVLADVRQAVEILRRTL